MTLATRWTNVCMYKHTQMFVCRHGCTKSNEPDTIGSFNVVNKGIRWSLPRGEEEELAVVE